MSYNNPNCNEIINNSSSYRCMVKYFCKDYLNLAKGEFKKRNNRKANLDDSEELFTIYAKMWYDWYIINPKKEKLYRKVANPVWEFGVSMRIDVKDATREFVRSINPEFKKVWNYHYDTWIVRNNKLEEFKQYCKINKFPYRKQRWIDYSDLAYNGVTNDF